MLEINEIATKKRVEAYKTKRITSRDRGVMVQVQITQDQKNFSLQSGFLGLNRVIPRLIAEDGFKSREEAIKWIEKYEQFFIQAVNNLEKHPVNSEWVNLIWQRHILDTVGYIENCSKWGKGYLHYYQVKDTKQDIISYGELARQDFVWGDSHSSLDLENFSDLVKQVRCTLKHKKVRFLWMEEAESLLDSNPESVILEYKCFLQLIMTKSKPVTPCKLVDEFWHQHILNSQEYFLFCNRVAGRYLYHIPHYEKKHKYHASNYKRTLREYKKLFGVSPPNIWKHMGESGGGGDNQPCTCPVCDKTYKSTMPSECVCGYVNNAPYSGFTNLGCLGFVMGFAALSNPVFLLGVFVVLLVFPLYLVYYSMAKSELKQVVIACPKCGRGSHAIFQTYRHYYCLSCNYKFLGSKHTDGGHLG